MDYVCEPYVFGGIREGAMGLAQGTWPSHPLRIYQLAMSTPARSGSLYITWLNSRLQKKKEWTGGMVVLAGSLLFEAGRSEEGKKGKRKK